MLRIVEQAQIKEIKKGVKLNLATWGTGIPDNDKRETHA